MLKHKKLLIATILVATVLYTGCTDSDGFSTSKTSDWTPDQEVIVINGHTLPPEPDPAVNNATLLGVDSNDNGVRDDVERWIYETYKDKHPIYIDIAMQAARGYKLVLEHPERAKEIHAKATAYLDCQSYYTTYAKYFNEAVLVKRNSGIDEYFRKSIYFDTYQRQEAYKEYDKLLSGDSYSLPKIENLKSLCDFNTSIYDKQ